MKSRKISTVKTLRHWKKKLKKTPEDIKTAHASCTWVSRIIGKMFLLSQAVYRFSTEPIKIPMTFSTEIRQTTLKFIWKQKHQKIVSNDIGITVCDLKLYYRAILNKTATKAQTQTNGTEAPEISLQTDSLLYFKKYIKSIYWKNNRLISHWSQEIHLYKNMTRSISLTHDQSS